MSASIRTSGTLIVAGLLLASPARSAEPAAPDTAVVPVEGVSVTATRAPENPLKTPAAVTVVGAERFAPTRQISLDDALRRVPGVFSQSRGGAQDVRITIRGYGARGNGERSNAGNMRGIRVLTDGIPVTEPDGRTSLDLIDLGSADRVEVLRSSGSVLYGNASGGVVNVLSPTGFAEGYLEPQFRVGSFGFHREQAVAGYTLGSARGTASLFNSTFDGWRDHSSSSTTLLQSRLSTPIDARTRMGVLLDLVSNLNRYPGALTQAQLDSAPQQANPTFVARDERRFNRVGRVGLTLDRGLTATQNLTLATWVEPKALQRSERNRYRDFARFHVGGSALWHMQAPGPGPWRWVLSAGADDQLQDGSIQFYDLGPGGSRGTTLIANKREGANSAGAFGQAELRSDIWSLRAAARYDNLWYLSEDRIDPSLNATQHFDHVTPKASLARYIGNHTVYASIGGGVESPAFNEIDPPPPLDTLTSLNPFLDPMISTSYELGVKGDLAEADGRFGRVQYDVALYWIDVENDIIPFDGGAYFFTAGKSRRRGAEVGLDWTPVPRWTFGGSVTMSDNEYVDYDNEYLGYDNGLGDFSGNEVAGLPPIFADAEVVGRFGMFRLAANARHVGHYFADDANTARTEAYTIFGARAEATWDSPFGPVAAFVSGENLTDEDYVASVFINGIAGQYYEPGLPANVAFGVTLRLP